MNAETTRRPLLPAWARALRMKCTRQRCQVARNTRATAALMPSCASEMTSLTPARPRRSEPGAGSRPRRSRPPRRRSPSRAPHADAVLTATAMVTAAETIRPASRTLT